MEGNLYITSGHPTVTNRLLLAAAPLVYLSCWKSIYLSPTPYFTCIAEMLSNNVASDVGAVT